MGPWKMYLCHWWSANHIPFGEWHLFLSSGFWRIKWEGVYKKSVLNTDIDSFLVIVCSTFLQFVSLHITLSQLCWDWIFFFFFPTPPKESKLSSAWFPLLVLKRSCELCTLSLAWHRSCKLVTESLPLLSLSKMIYISVYAVLWQNLYIYAFTQLGGEQAQLSLQHNNCYYVFCLTRHNFYHFMY